MLEQMINKISLTPNVYAGAVSDFFKAEAGKITIFRIQQQMRWYLYFFIILNFFSMIR